MLKAYSWLYTQILLLTLFEEPYLVLGIKPGLLAFKGSALSSVLSLQHKFQSISYAAKKSERIHSKEILEYLLDAI